MRCLVTLSHAELHKLLCEQLCKEVGHFVHVFVVQRHVVTKVKDLTSWQHQLFEGEDHVLPDREGTPVK